MFTPCFGIGAVTTLCRRCSLQLIFITNHSKKAEELSRYLDYPIKHLKLDLPEVQSLDPYVVACTKAKAAYERIKCPVLVEDFSLSFEALGRLPGPLIKWFLTELDPDELCKLLDSYSTRKAIAQTCFALCDKNVVHIFDGKMEGSIAASPRGGAGYGTDGIFIPSGWDKTWGEMTKEEQVESSLRRLGLKKLEKYLAALPDLS
jgi:non-canonical purine NTP pyrophosphatase (RdgB/HAM1 family)